MTINRVASGRPCGRVSARRVSPCSGPERFRGPVVWGERLGHPGNHGGPPCSSGPGRTYGMYGTIYGVELERDPRATGSCPLLPQGGLTRVTPLLKTRECCCISRFIARLFAHPAPLMVLVSRLCLPMASVHQFAFVPSVCFSTGTPSPCLYNSPWVAALLPVLVQQPCP